MPALLPVEGDVGKAHVADGGEGKLVVLALGFLQAQDVRLQRGDGLAHDIEPDADELMFQVAMVRDKAATA